MINRFSNLFKEIERDMGTNDLSILVLESIRESFRRYRGNKVEDILCQMKELLQIIYNTEPKFAIVIDNIFRIFEQIHSCVEESKRGIEHPFAYYRSCILTSIENVIKQNKKDKADLLKQAMNIDIQGKTILIHDQSHTVHSVLLSLKKKQHFKVIVAEQDMEKTLSNIEFLSEAGIPFQTVPDYMLSNIEDDIDVCFFGAMTMKSTYDFVASNGSYAVISQFHLLGKEIYVFITTSKFSLWEAKKKAVVSRHTQTRKHPFRDLSFERLKFSHDRVPLENVTFTVTEDGILSPEKLKKVYQIKFKEHRLITKKLEAFEARA